MGVRPGRFLVHALVTLSILALALFIFSFFGGNALVVGNLVLRAQTGNSYPLTSPVVSYPSPEQAVDQNVTEIGPRPRNVVVIIGDGMGVNAVSAASLILDGPNTSLTMTETPFVGLMSTWSTDNLIPDSASTATSMFTGFKTRKKAIGILEDGRVVRNLFEAARVNGSATGVVTTSALADATPAALTAHSNSRDNYGEILEQVFNSGTDLLIGGDWTGKRKARHIDRYMEIIENAEQLGAERGYNVIRNPELLDETSLPLLALFPPRPDFHLQHGPPLASSARQAFRLLEKTQGFILLIECEVIDEAAHENNFSGVMDGMRELDEAVALILDLAERQGNTLVVVAADHDTGGPALVDGDFATGRVDVRWADDSHISAFVPVFAFGPGAETLTLLLDSRRFERQTAAEDGSMDLRKSLKRLVLGPEHKAIPVMGRNDRCWCGSGKKYKACHLGSDDRKRLAERSAMGGPSKGGMF
jgi:alkaline phosphatase